MLDKMAIRSNSDRMLDAKSPLHMLDFKFVLMQYLFFVTC